MIDEKTLRDIITNQTAWFEDQVLYLLMHDHEFFRKFQSLICVGDNPKKYQSDFGPPFLNNLYEAIKTSRLYISQEPPTEKFILSHVQAQVEIAKVGQGAMSADEIPMLKKKLDELLNMDFKSSREVIVQGVPLWIEMVRTGHAVRAASRKKGSTTEQMMLTMRGIKSAVNVVASDRTKSREAGDDIGRKKNPEDKQIRFPTGVGPLDKALGGGIARKESCLIIGPEGSGKTVMAVQVATSLAMDQGLNGLLISTEQEPEELTPRWVSARCDIPFDKVKDGVDLEDFTPEKQSAILACRDQLKKNLRFLHWGGSGDSRRSIVTDLNDEIDQFEKEHGVMDFLVFDWIGRGVKVTEANASILRHILQQGADHMADIARERNKMVLFFGQAAQSKAMNKPRVDASMISECTSMGQSASWVLGLSAMMQEIEKASSNPGRPGYQAKQFLFTSKGRKSQGGLIPILRKFAYQKFDNVS